LQRYIKSKPFIRHLQIITKGLNQQKTILAVAV
jgi:hypothetical protein